MTAWGLQNQHATRTTEYLMNLQLLCIPQSVQGLCLKLELFNNSKTQICAHHDRYKIGLYLLGILFAILATHSFEY